MFGVPCMTGGGLRDLCRWPEHASRKLWGSVQGNREGDLRLLDDADPFSDREGPERVPQGISSGHHRHPVNMLRKRAPALGCLWL